MTRRPLTPDQIQHVHDCLTRAIRDTLTELADQLERESPPEWAWLHRAAARGLRPDPVGSPRRDA
jgi:hypothetical protein